MNRRNNADEEVEPYTIARLKSRGDRLRPHTGDARLAVGLVGEPVGHVVRELTVDADRLEPLDNRVA